MKRILIFILIFVMTASFACVSYAMEIEEETIAGSVVDTNIPNDNGFIFVGNSNWEGLFSANYNIGEYINLTLPSDGRFVYQYSIDLLNHLTDEQKYLILSSSSVHLKIEYGIDYFSDPSPVSTNIFIQGTFKVSNKDAFNFVGPQFSTAPSNAVYGLETDYFDNSQLETMMFYIISYFDYPDRLIDMQYRINNLVFTLTTIGVDKSTADIVVNLGNINNSINQGFDNLGNQIGDVQEDINSGFNEVGGKLDSMLTPDSNNQQAVDQMGGQVNNNKQEAEDIKNQIDSLDKPDPDDLIDQIDPDQFINNDDEAVQEMTGILASVTGSKVVKNYLLLLICVGIVSFVVYGKKGG